MNAWNFHNKFFERVLDSLSQEAISSRNTVCHQYVLFWEEDLILLVLLFLGRIYFCFYWFWWVLGFSAKDREQPGGKKYQQMLTMETLGVALGICSKYEVCMYIHPYTTLLITISKAFFPPQSLFSVTNSYKSKMSILDFVESQSTATGRSLESDRPVFRSQLCRRWAVVMEDKFT